MKVESEENSEEPTSNIISDILNPTLHDNDFLVSFVRLDQDEKPDINQLLYSDGKQPSRSKCRMMTSRMKKDLDHECDVRDPSRSPVHRWNTPLHQDERQDRSSRLSPKQIRQTSSEELKLHRSRKFRRRRSDFHREEEVYTDKDRAAAVNMGSRDIKQSLKMKRKHDRNKMMQIPDEAEPSSMLALGMKELRCANLCVALSCINKALELSPRDQDALMARSRCYLLLGQPRNALDDAEKALRKKTTALHRAKALFTKAEALYYLGDFEMSLVHYFRGMKIRPEFDGFRLGAQKAQEAIQMILGNERALVEEDGHFLEFQSNSKGRIQDRTPTDNCIAPGAYLTRPKRKIRINESLENQAPSLNSHSRLTSGHHDTNTVSHRQLDDDKKYLMGFIKMQDVRGTRTLTAQRLRSQALEGVTFLRSRSKFWNPRPT